MQEPKLQSNSILPVVIYTDGGCLGNPGPGGYGAILIQVGRIQELSGGFRLTTNNRMELLAAIQGLSTLKKPGKVEVYTDSRYLADAVQKGWLAVWRQNGWRKSDRGKVLNKDLWQRLSALLEIHQVKFFWIEGHSGNRYNERCDRLSRQAATRLNLPADPGYEEPVRPGSLFEGF